MNLLIFLLWAMCGFTSMPLRRSKQVAAGWGGEYSPVRSKKGVGLCIKRLYRDHGGYGNGHYPLPSIPSQRLSLRPEGNRRPAGRDCPFVEAVGLTGLGFAALTGAEPRSFAGSLGFSRNVPAPVSIRSGLMASARSAVGFGIGTVAAGAPPVGDGRRGRRTPEAPSESSLDRRCHSCCLSSLRSPTNKHPALSYGRGCPASECMQGIAYMSAG